VHVLARTKASEGACPPCGVMSRWVHSRYQRQLADTASGGQEVLIHLDRRRSGRFGIRPIRRGCLRAQSDTNVVVRAAPSTASQRVRLAAVLHSQLEKRFYPCTDVRAALRMQYRAHG